MQRPAKHWADADAAALEKDSPPPFSAPRAGGEVLTPKINMDWEWELFTKVKPSGVSAAPTAKQGRVTHTGGCHCGAVRFQCTTTSSDLVVFECNCSDCRMRRNLHFVVPKADLKFLSEDTASKLAEYRWGSGTARHLFCATCGISPFYRPRSNPDGWGVTLPCIDGGTISSVELRRFDGLNWEACFNGDGEGASIKGFSKTTNTANAATASATATAESSGTAAAAAAAAADDDDDDDLGTNGGSGAARCPWVPSSGPPSARHERREGCREG